MKNWKKWSEQITADIAEYLRRVPLPKDRSGSESHELQVLQKRLWAAIDEWVDNELKTE